MNDHRRALPSIGTALLGALGALGVIGVLGAPSLASAEVSADSGELDEIVVTASLRALPESQLPGSVSVLDAGTLRDAGQQNFADVVALVPNLNWAGDTSLPRYFQIRGIGELQQYQGAPNPSVGFLIDDIDFSGLGGVATLFDVDHIEVLRGPQGTLYGANALAGLIYVKSAEPQDRFGGRVEIDAGDYALHSVGAVLTGPVPALDSAFRLAVQQYYSDGFYDNVYLHRKNIDDRDELSMRAKWRYQPSTDWLVDVTVLRLQIDNGYDAWSLFGNRNTESDDPSADRQYSTGLSVHTTYTGFGGLTLTTIGTFADSVIDYGYDGDWGNPILWAPYTYEYTENQIRHRSTRSLELRLADTAQHGLSWLFGVYGFQLREGLTDTSAGLYVDPFDASQNTDTLTVLDSSYRSTHGALYGQLDGDLGTHSRWSLGLRGERQTTGYQDLTTNLDAASTANRFHPGYDLWGGQASLDYALTAGQRLYALLSRGYKAGGFNLSPGLAANEIAYAPENDLNIEFGDKATLAGGALRIDGDVFYMVRKSLQLLTGTQLDPDNPDAFVFYTGNAASGDNYGLEGTLAWRATRSLELGGSLGLLQTQYRGFVQSDVVLPSRELPNAPNWQAALNGTWRDPRGPYLRVDVTGMGGFYYDMPPNWTASKPYGLVNAKLGWQNERYEVTVWGRNLLDKDYTVRGFYFGDQPPNFPNTLYRQLGDPRNWGMHATVKF